MIIIKPVKIKDFLKNIQISWTYLSENPKAIQILEKNLNKVDWDNLCINPNACLNFFLLNA